MSISEPIKQKIADLTQRFSEQLEIKIPEVDPQTSTGWRSWAASFFSSAKPQAELDYAAVVDFATAAFAAAKSKYGIRTEQLEGRLDDLEWQNIGDADHDLTTQTNTGAAFALVEECFARSQQAKLAREARDAQAALAAAAQARQAQMAADQTENTPLRNFFTGITAEINFTVHQEDGKGYEMSDPNVRYLPTYGDGDCGPHTVILSLLCEGMFLQRPRELMVRILYDMFNENKDGVRGEEGMALSDQGFNDFLIAYLQAYDRGSIEAFAKTYLTYPDGGRPHPTIQFLTRCARAAARAYFINNKLEELGDEELEQFDGNNFTNLQYTHELLEQRYGLVTDIPTSNIFVRPDPVTGEIRVHAGAIAETRSRDHRIQWLSTGGQTDSDSGHYVFRMDINEITVPAPQDHRALIAKLQRGNSATPPFLPSGAPGSRPGPGSVHASVSASGPTPPQGFIATAYRIFNDPARNSAYRIKEENAEQQIYTTNRQHVGTVREMPPLELSTGASVESELATIDFDSSKELAYYHAMRSFLEVSDAAIGLNNPARDEYKIRIPDLKTADQVCQFCIAYMEVFKPGATTPQNYIKIEPTDAARNAFYNFFQKDHESVFSQWLLEHNDWLTSKGYNISDIKRMRADFSIQMGFGPAGQQAQGPNQTFLAGYQPPRRGWFPKL